MLVLSRKANERLVIPSINTTIEVVELKAGRVRLGIDAPREVQVVREELMGQAFQRQAVANTGPTMNRDAVNRDAAGRDAVNHALRNRLNLASMFTDLAQQQLRDGQVEAALVTLDRVQAQIHAPVRVSVEPTNPRLVKAKALLVEDDPNELELLAGLVRLAGFDVVTAADGIDALNQLDHDTVPMVMLLDMMLPRCDGMSTVRNMRRNPRFDGVKVIAMSGYSAADLGVVDKANGIDAWFQKPIRAEALVAQLRELAAETSLAV